jgi:hypothetical protein
VWCAASVPLELPYVDLFEVHGGVSVAQQLPLYSEAFRGYGLNKQQHARHAAALGFRFLVSLLCVEVCGVVWCGVVWCGVVWCGVVWCGGEMREGLRCWRPGACKVVVWCVGLGCALLGSTCVT